LVGHSLGCQIVKQYASLYPANIKGIIFLDPGYDERKLRAQLADTVWQKREQALKMYQPQFNAAQQAELDSLNTNCELADHITSLPKVPIILFTATRINPSFPGSAVELKVKRETHHLWLESLPWAKQIEVKESRHYIHNDEPNVVIDAIYKMIQETSK
jgi:pimeloyl-ACP methyl ester carboxylesterase